MASAAANPPAVPPPKLATHWRVLITIALLVHLTAIIAAPWSMPVSAGPLANLVITPFRYYYDATYSGHGYRFFCPEPGPSHLVRFTLTMADGSSRSDFFPNIQTQWPRLFYHRYFMLSEKFGGLFGPLAEGEPGPTDLPEAHVEWQAMRDTFNTTARSYAKHLLQITGAKEVKLELMRHLIPLQQQVANGLKLNDPRMYQILWTSPIYTAELF